jgi:hypothetical protein
MRRLQGLGGAVLDPVVVGDQPLVDQVELVDPRWCSPTWKNRAVSPGGSRCRSGTKTSMTKQPRTAGVYGVMGFGGNERN